MIQPGNTRWGRLFCRGSERRLWRGRRCCISVCFSTRRAKRSSSCYKRKFTAVGTETPTTHKAHVSGKGRQTQRCRSSVGKTDRYSFPRVCFRSLRKAPRPTKRWWRWRTSCLLTFQLQQRSRSTLRGVHSWLFPVLPADPGWEAACWPIAMCRLGDHPSNMLHWTQAADLNLKLAF